MGKATVDTLCGGVNYSVKTFLLLFVFLFSINFISASPSQFGYNYLEPGQQVISGANYSINVNNTEHLQGRDTNQLYTYFQSLFDNVYCKLTGCTMTGDLRLNNAGINNTNYVQFNTSFTDGHAEGRLQWNTDDGTLEVGLSGNNVNLQIGQETLVKVKNGETSNIPNGAVVYIYGASGQRPEVKLANASIINESLVLGVATEEISTFGYVTITGLVRDINTSGMTEGSQIWLSTIAGKFTTTRPTAPNINVFIGYVVYSHATQGIIIIRPNLIPRMQGLSSNYGTPSTTGEYYSWNQTTGRFELINSSLGNYYNKTQIDSNFSKYYNTTQINNSFVPYSGATSNVDLNGKNLTNISRLGIGTTSPSTRLEVTGDTFTALRISGSQSSGGQASATLQLFAPNSPSATNSKNFAFNNVNGLSGGSGQNYWVLQARNDDGTFKADLMSILHNGNVGIGTTTPTAKLNVNGNATIGNSTGNITIDNQGNLMLNGEATQWDDMVFPLIGGTTPASNPPSLTQFKNGTYAYAFGDKIAGQESQLFATLQMSHSYKLTTDIDCHIHWACGGSATTTNNVTWALEVTKADIGGTFGNTVIYRVNQTCGTAYVHQLADWHSIGNFTAISGIAQMRVYRDSAYAGDTYTGDDAFGLSLDCHYEKDSIGSRQEYTK